MKPQHINQCFRDEWFRAACVMVPVCTLQRVSWYISADGHTRSSYMQFGVGFQGVSPSVSRGPQNRRRAGTDTIDVCSAIVSTPVVLPSFQKHLQIS